MARSFSFGTLLLMATALLIFSQPDAEGCAAIGRRDRPEATISIAEESAIIVWDPVKKVQHFIRRASFDTKLPDFGFLVPTPNMPKLPLGEVEDGAFRVLETWILPKIVEKTRLQLDPLFCSLGCTSMAMLRSNLAPDGVRVLHEQKVGGYESAVLEADNTEDLSNWLTKNGYTNDPELQSWLFPYVAAKWKITAFKIIQDPQTGQLAKTKPVRMSFATDRPFFPYREPEAKESKKEEKKAWQDPRMLRVFFVSDTRMEGKLGDADWHAKVKWSDQLTDEQRKQLATDTGVSADEIPAKAWMTTFEDSASPRPGKEEVYFDPSKDNTPIRPPDFIRYSDVWVPIDVMIFGIVVIVTIAVGVVRKWKNQA